MIDIMTPVRPRRPRPRARCASVAAAARRARARPARWPAVRARGGAALSQRRRARRSRPCSLSRCRSRAALLGLELELGERRLQAVAVAKAQATERYEKAIDAGDAAVLLEAVGNGLHTVSVGNLKPGESAVIRYRHAELLDANRGLLRLQVPTVIAPRYGNPGDAGTRRACRADDGSPRGVSVRHRAAARGHRRRHRGRRGAGVADAFDPRAQRSEAGTVVRLAQAAQ
jgi:hypothetical protein